MKPEAWQSGTVDAIATASTDGRRLVIKAVNYQGEPNTLLVRLHGSKAPVDATVTLSTLTAGLNDAASLEQPNKIAAVERTMTYAPVLTIELASYMVAVLEIAAK